MQNIFLFHKCTCMYKLIYFLNTYLLYLRKNIETKSVIPYLQNTILYYLTCMLNSNDHVMYDHLFNLTELRFLVVKNLNIMVQTINCTKLTSHCSSIN
jgi:hypothetical protein